MITTLIIIVWFSLVIEFVHMSIFGWFLPNKKVEIFLHQNLQIYIDYGMNTKRDTFHGKLDMPYIAKSSSIFSKWYIAKNGCIWRWSKASRMLDEAAKAFPKKIETEKIDNFIN